MTYSKRRQVSPINIDPERIKSVLENMSVEIEGQSNTCQVAGQIDPIVDKYKLLTILSNDGEQFICEIVNSPSRVILGALVPSLNAENNIFAYDKKVYCHVKGLECGKLLEQSLKVPYYAKCVDDEYYKSCTIGKVVVLHDNTIYLDENGQKTTEARYELQFKKLELDSITPLPQRRNSAASILSRRSSNASIASRRQPIKRPSTPIARQSVARRPPPRPTTTKKETYKITKWVLVSYI